MTAGPASWSERRPLAESLRRHRDNVAEYVTEEFLRRHPDWLKKYGDLAWTRGVEDARFHVEFLAGAIESGDARAFTEYARWTAGVLGSRGLSTEFLLENLQQLNERFSSLLDPAGSRIVDEYVTAARAGAGDGQGRAVDDAGSSDDAGLPQRTVYTQAILQGDRRAALNVVTEMLRAGYSVPDVYCDVLQPAQYELGRRWERNEISVAREHMATAITQFIVAQLYSRLERPERERGRAIVTGVQGELHQLGANMVADVLEADGWDVRFLGTQTPRRDILRAIDEHEPAVLGISATMLFNVSHVADLVQEARRQFGEALRVVLGGGAFRDRPALATEVGADAASFDLRSAVTTVRDLTNAEA